MLQWNPVGTLSVTSVYTLPKVCTFLDQLQALGVLNRPEVSRARVRVRDSS